MQFSCIYQYLENLKGMDLQDFLNRLAVVKRISAPVQKQVLIVHVFVSTHAPLHLLIGPYNEKHCVYRIAFNLSEMRSMISAAVQEKPFAPKPLPVLGS